jgi:hypothetical protein
MIEKVTLTRAEKAQAQQAIKAYKAARQGRVVIFDKARGTTVQTIIKPQVRRG